MPRITASAFIAKWRDVQLTERPASQQHFLDLCEVVEHPKPAEADPAGEWFTFERDSDERDFYRPTSECLAAVDAVLGRR
jgi:hypothetical protein